MHRGTSLLAGLAAGLILSTGAPASAQSISVDAPPGVNFSAYKTYAWVDTTPPAGLNPVMYQRIIGDIDQALAGKGYSKGDSADLSLILTLGTQDKTDVETWGRFGLQTSVYQYTQGQLALDVFETASKRAVWHGQASKTVNPDKPNGAAVDKGIAKLMAKFPPTSGG